MKYRSNSKKISFSALPKRKGFSLPEVMAALLILALITSSVMIVIGKCVTSAADSALRMQAFEVARENMENLLASDSVSEMAEYGDSNMYPEILWNTVVETFTIPRTSRIWVQATCSAEYTDSEGLAQTVELTNWITNLTKKQLLQLVEERKEELERLAAADQIIETVQEAAEYAGVEPEIVQQWANPGDMPVTDDGYYIKLYLDLYAENNGEPPAEARMETDEIYEDITGRLGRPVIQTPPGSTRPVPAGPRGPRPREAPHRPRGPEGRPGTQPHPPSESSSDRPFWIGPDGTPYNLPQLQEMDPDKLFPIVFDGSPP